MNIFEWPKELLIAIELHSKLFEEECRKMLKDNKDDLPIILAYLKGVDWCRKIVDGRSTALGWSFSITTLNEMVKVGAISKRSGDMFKSLSKDPQKYLHVFNCEIPKVNLRFFPFKKNKRKDNKSSLDIDYNDLGMMLKHSSLMDFCQKERKCKFFKMQTGFGLCKNPLCYLSLQYQLRYEKEGYEWSNMQFNLREGCFCFRTAGIFQSCPMKNVKLSLCKKVTDDFPAPMRVEV